MSDLPALEPHGPIQTLLPDVFYVTGSVVMVPLMRLTRNMTIVRSGGALTLINSVRLSDAGQAELEALGEVKNVVRIGVHGMDDAWYVQKYGATLWGLPNVKHANDQVAAETLADDHLPCPDLQLFRFEDTVAPESALLYTGEGGGLLITCDCVQNWEHTKGCSPVAKVATRLMGFIKPAQIGPPWRKGMTPKGGSLEPDFQRLATLDFVHLIAGHGSPLRDTAKTAFAATLQRVYG